LKGSHADTKRTAEARRYALKLLHYRSRSEKEMTWRLRKKGFDANGVSNTVEYLKDAGLIKDEELASELLRTSLKNKYLGRKGVKMFLLRRGIKKDLVNETLSGLSENIEKDTAQRHVEKKLRTLKSYPRDTIKKRIWGMLQRRGFSPEIINTAIKSIEDKTS